MPAFSDIVTGVCDSCSHLLTEFGTCSGLRKVHVWSVQ